MTGKVNTWGCVVALVATFFQTACMASLQAPQAPEAPKPAAAPGAVPNCVNLPPQPDAAPLPPAPTELIAAPAPQPTRHERLTAKGVVPSADPEMVDCAPEDFALSSDSTYWDQDANALLAPPNKLLLVVRDDKVSYIGMPYRVSAGQKAVCKWVRFKPGITWAELPPTVDVDVPMEFADGPVVIELKITAHVLLSNDTLTTAVEQFHMPVQPGDAPLNFLRGHAGTPGHIVQRLKRWAWNLLNPAAAAGQGDNPRARVRNEDLANRNPVGPDLSAPADTSVARESLHQLVTILNTGIHPESADKPGQVAAKLLATQKLHLEPFQFDDILGVEGWRVGTRSENGGKATKVFDLPIPPDDSKLDSSDFGV